MVAPLSQIEADLKEAKEKWPDARKIWASGGDSFALSTEKQIAVWDLMRTYYPKARIPRMPSFLILSTKASKRFAKSRPMDLMKS